MDRNLPTLHLPPDALPRLSPLFQKGIRVEIETGCTLKCLLCDYWGLSPEYVQGRISTLFLNGKPVDDITAARVMEGCVLALSSAMPGLVGAVMRRDGFFSLLREGITHRGNIGNSDIRRGVITVKLFNLLINEIGPDFFLRGFVVKQEDLATVLPEGFQTTRCKTGDIFIVSTPE